jgi:hypothetical protein
VTKNNEFFNSLHLSFNHNQSLLSTKDQEILSLQQQLQEKEESLEKSKQNATAFYEETMKQQSEKLLSFEMLVETSLKQHELSKQALLQEVEEKKQAFSALTIKVAKVEQALEEKKEELEMKEEQWKKLLSSMEDVSREEREKERKERQLLEEEKIATIEKKRSLVEKENFLLHEILLFSFPMDDVSSPLRTSTPVKRIDEDNNILLSSLTSDDMVNLLSNNGNEDEDVLARLSHLDSAVSLSPSSRFETLDRLPVSSCYHSLLSQLYSTISSLQSSKTVALSFLSSFKASLLSKDHAIRQLQQEKATLSLQLSSLKTSVQRWDLLSSEMKTEYSAKLNTLQEQYELRISSLQEENEKVITELKKNMKKAYSHQKKEFLQAKEDFVASYERKEKELLETIEKKERERDSASRLMTMMTNKEKESSPLLLEDSETTTKEGREKEEDALKIPSSSLFVVDHSTEITDEDSKDYFAAPIGSCHTSKRSVDIQTETPVITDQDSSSLSATPYDSLEGNIFHLTSSASSSLPLNPPVPHSSLSPSSSTTQLQILRRSSENGKNDLSLASSSHLVRRSLTSPLLPPPPPSTSSSSPSPAASISFLSSQQFEQLDSVLSNLSLQETYLSSVKFQLKDLENENESLRTSNLQLSSHNSQLSSQLSKSNDQILSLQVEFHRCKDMYSSLFQKEEIIVKELQEKIAMIQEYEKMIIILKKEKKQEQEEKQEERAKEEREERELAAKEKKEKRELQQQQQHQEQQRQRNEVELLEMVNTIKEELTKQFEKEIAEEKQKLLSQNKFSAEQVKDIVRQVIVSFYCFLLFVIFSLSFFNFCCFLPFCFLTSLIFWFPFLSLLLSIGKEKDQREISSKTTSNANLL